MKKYGLLLLLTASLLSCDVRKKDKIADDAQKLKELALKDSTTVLVVDTAYNFGKTTDGEKVEYNYRFKNTGSNPLVITSATASCGCTVPQKPEMPVPAGDTGFIKVVFDSKGRIGQAHKTITVISNARPDFPELLLTGEVIAKQ